MDLIKYSSPGTDRFNRKFPVKITFNTGETVYGHIKSSNRQLIGNTTKTIDINFLIIKNIEDWCKNIDEDIENRDIIIFNDDIIDQISIFKTY